jgi:glycosyltransferase involved in cell wall biosynthesis
MAERTEDPSTVTVAAADAAYEDRTPEEVGSLTDGFKATPYGGYNYVAEPAPGYDVAGIWHAFHTDSRSGYAAHAVAVSWMINKELGIPLMLVPHRAKDIDVDRFPADREALYSEWHSYKRAVGKPELLIVSLPPELQMAELAPKMIYYSAYEASHVSQWTTGVCNDDLMTAVWCVSEFVAQAFRAGGVHADKLDVVRPMLCGGAWQMPELPKVADRDDFVFGTMGTWHGRKGFHHLVRGYFGAFKREDKVVLNIRTSAFGGVRTIRDFTEMVVSEIAEIAREFGDFDYPRSKKMPRVRLQTGTDQSDAEVIEWLGGLDGYVSPSFGEGLGIPAVWAKGMGTPLITTDCAAVGAMVREIDEARGSAQSLDLLVPTVQVEVPMAMWKVSQMFARDATWAGYEPAALGAAMRTLVDRPRQRDECGARATRHLFGEATVAPLCAAITRRTGGALP